MRRGVESACRILVNNKQKPAEPGALYHALDGLILYRARMTGKLPVAAGTKVSRPVAKKAPAKKAPVLKPLTIPAKLKRKPVVAVKPAKISREVPRRAARLPIPPQP